MKEHKDSSHALDLVTVFQSTGTTGELQALVVQSLLESNGIEAVLVGDTRLPYLPDEIRVARKHADQARALIAEAQAVGPKGAEEAEKSGER